LTWLTGTVKAISRARKPANNATKKHEKRYSSRILHEDPHHHHDIKAGRRDARSTLKTGYVLHETLAFGVVLPPLTARLGMRPGGSIDQQILESRYGPRSWSPLTRRADREQYERWTIAKRTWKCG